MSDALHKPASIYEHQGRAVLIHELDDAVVKLVPHLVGSDWAKLGSRHFNREIQRSLVPDVDDHRTGSTVASKKMCHLLNGLLRCRQPDARRRTTKERLQPFQRKRQMRSALVVSHSMNFIYDHGFHITQN